MSLGNLPRIADTLIQGGKSPGTPAAVIEQGTTARQRVVTAPLAHIAQAAQDAGLHTPAMTVVGDVVSLRQELQWQERGALYGKKCCSREHRTMCGRQRFRFESTAQRQQR